MEASADAGNALHRDRKFAVAREVVAEVRPIPDSGTARNASVQVGAGEDAGVVEGVVAGVQDVAVDVVGRNRVVGTAVVV